MIDKKTWEEFRESGLLWWVNSLLHMFGWAIVVEFDEDKNISSVYPARCKFRGFSEESNTNGYKKVSNYLLNNIESIHKETIEDTLEDI